MKFKLPSRNSGLRLNQGDVLLNVTGLEQYSSQDKEKLKNLVDKIKKVHHITPVSIDKNNNLSVSKRFF